MNTEQRAALNEWLAGRPSFLSAPEVLVERVYRDEKELGCFVPRQRLERVVVNITLFINDTEEEQQL